MQKPGLLSAVTSTTGAALPSAASVSMRRGPSRNGITQSMTMASGGAWERSRSRAFEGVGVPLDLIPFGQQHLRQRLDDRVVVVDDDDAPPLSPL